MYVKHTDTKYLYSKTSIQRVHEYKIYWGNNLNNSQDREKSVNIVAQVWYFLTVSCFSIISSIKLIFKGVFHCGFTQIYTDTAFCFIYSCNCRTRILPVGIPINMALCASTGPVLAINGMFTGMYASKTYVYQICTVIFTLQNKHLFIHM